MNIWLPHTAYQIKIWDINLEEIGHFKLGEGRVGGITQTDLFHMSRSNYFLCEWLLFPCREMSEAHGTLPCWLQPQVIAKVASRV